MTSLLERFVKKYGRLPTETDPDYLEMLQMSKYTVVDVPYYKPGKCANCGASKNDGRKYIDFGLEVDWYGIVYLCGTCLNDVAKNAGLFEGLISRIHTLEKELELEKINKTSLDELKEKGDEIYESITSRFRELEEFYVSVQPPRDSSDSDPDSDPNGGEKANGEQGTDSTESGVTESNKPATKSASSTGRKDIPSLTSLIDV